MKHEEFIEKCIEIVVEEENALLHGTHNHYLETTKKDVFIVWSCKTLQNSKAILSTKIKGAHTYEITLNGDKGEIYVDKYGKRSNRCIII